MHVERLGLVSQPDANRTCCERAVITVHTYLCTGSTVVSLILLLLVAMQRSQDNGDTESYRAALSKPHLTTSLGGVINVLVPTS